MACVGIKRTGRREVRRGELKRFTKVVSPNFQEKPRSAFENFGAAISSGALEAREQMSLNTTSNVLTVQGFTVQPGSPSPTPQSALNFGSILQSYQVNVDKIAFSCQPVPSVLITGKVSNNSPKTPYGDITGALIAVGIGYTTDNPPKLNNVVVLVPGVAGLYSAAASGTLTFASSSATPPGSNNGPTIVFTPGATQTTAQKQLVLDASKSTDANGLQLTYAWTETSGPAAGINLSNTATPLITFAGGKGDYTFQVTVTNSQGVMSTATTTITYNGLTPRSATQLQKPARYRPGGREGGQGQSALAAE
jgi:hypothetical protein